MRERSHTYVPSGNRKGNQKKRKEKRKKEKNMYFRRDEKGKNMERLYICSVRECSESEIKTRKLARERCDGRKACERRAACTTYVFVHADSPSLQCTSDALVSSGRKRRKEKKRSDDVRWRCFCFVQKTKRILREMKIFRDQSRNKREHFSVGN